LTRIWGDVYDLPEYKVLNDCSAGSLLFAINLKGFINLQKINDLKRKSLSQRCNYHRKFGDSSAANCPLEVLSISVFKDELQNRNEMENCFKSERGGVFIVHVDRRY
jgi:hypothetical protein